MFCEPSILLSEHDAIVEELRGRLRQSELDCARYVKRLDETIADLDRVDEMLHNAQDELESYEEGTVQDEGPNEFERLNTVTTCYAAFAIFGSIVAIVLANTLTHRELIEYHNAH